MTTRYFQECDMCKATTEQSEYTIGEVPEGWIKMYTRHPDGDELWEFCSKDCVRKFLDRNLAVINEHSQADRD